MYFHKVRFLFELPDLGLLFGYDTGVLNGILLMPSFLSIMGKPGLRFVSVEASIWCHVLTISIRNSYYIPLYFIQLQ
jgi:hypothetical protein